jgi:hypothetical protein
MCGASPQQNQIEASQQSFANQMQQQATTIFGQGAAVYNDLFNTYSPIFQAGPGQQGFAPQELSSLNSQAITGVGQSYNNEKQAVGDQQAAQGGGRSVLPGGATTGPQLQLAENAGNQTASELNQITQANYAQGRQNWLTAANGLAGAGNAYSAAEGANSGAVGAYGAAAGTANQIAQENAGPLQALIGAAGSVAGAAAGNPALFSGGGDTTPSIPNINGPATMGTDAYYNIGIQTPNGLTGPNSAYGAWGAAPGYSGPGTPGT